MRPSYGKCKIPFRADTIPIRVVQLLMIEVKKELGGNVRVSIDVGRETLVFIWKMSPEQAQAEAEEIYTRYTGKAA